MSKLILKTNLADNTFSVEQKTIDVPTNKIFTPDPVNLIITPNNNYVLNVNDFITGGLPKIISSIIFNQSNNNVIATVYFNSMKLKESFNSVYLPISGKSSLSVNSFVLNETMPIDSNAFIIEKNTFSVNVKSSGNPIIKEHDIQGAPGSKNIIMTRHFSVPDGYYFSSQPSYVISGPSSKNYQVSTSVKKDDRDRVIAKSITVRYIFSPSIFSTKITDNIVFSYSVVKIEPKHEEVVMQNLKEHKIYSIDTGVNPDTGGGNKFITIKGSPGTPFKVLVQDGDNNSYNFKTGVFSGDGEMLEGIIPPANRGVGYGVYRTVVNVLPSSAGVDITTRVLTNEEVDHEALAESYSTASTYSPPSVQVSVEETKTAGTLELALHNGGETAFIISRPMLDSDTVLSATLREFDERITLYKNGTYSIGPHNSGSSISEFLTLKPFVNTNKDKITTLTWLIETDAVNKYIRINRQPLFNQAATFVAWDSAYDSEDTKLHNSSGTEIKTDWGNITADPDETLDFGAFTIEPIAFAAGQQTRIEHGVTAGSPEDIYAYKSILISVKVNGTFGSTSIKPELNLKNFLSIHSL